MEQRFAASMSMSECIHLALEVGLDSHTNMLVPKPSGAVTEEMSGLIDEAGCDLYILKRHSDGVTRMHSIRSVTEVSAVDKWLNELSSSPQ